MTRFPTLFAIVALLGCMTLSTAEIRQRLVGLDERDVIECMGPPESVTALGQSGEAQLWSYSAELLREVATRPGALGEDTTGWPTRCQFNFTIRDGIVTSFRAIGRRHDGLDAEAVCTRKVRQCIEPLDSS